MKERVVPDAYTPANEAELETLRTRWARGELQDHAVRLLAFIERHRDEINALAGPRVDAPGRLESLKLQIVRLESVCSLSEMQDQTRAIRDEIWYRGEKGDYDRRHIAHEWASRHAAAWRRWRLKEYLFVVDRCAEAMLKHLDGPAQ